MDAIGARIRDAWLAIPLPFRYFVRDAVEGAIIALVGINFVLPHSLSEATTQAFAAWATISPAVLSSARRYLWPWFKELVRYLFPNPDQPS